MSSWSALTRDAARLPSAISPSMRLRRAEMMAISLPEKKPLPRSSTTMEAAMKRGSDMGLGSTCYQTGRHGRRLAPALSL